MQAFWDYRLENKSAHIPDSKEAEENLKHNWFEIITGRESFWGGPFWYFELAIQLAELIK